MDIDWEHRFRSPQVPCYKFHEVLIVIEKSHEFRHFANLLVEALSRVLQHSGKISAVIPECPDPLIGGEQGFC